MPSRCRRSRMSGDAQRTGRPVSHASVHERLQHRRRPVRVVVAVEVGRVAPSPARGSGASWARASARTSAGLRARQPFRLGGQAPLRRPPGSGACSGGSAGGPPVSATCRPTPRPGCSPRERRRLRRRARSSPSGSRWSRCRWRCAVTMPWLMPAVRPKSSAFTMRRLLFMSSSRSSASATAPSGRLHGQRRGTRRGRLQAALDASRPATGTP